MSKVRDPSLRCLAVNPSSFASSIGASDPTGVLTRLASEGPQVLTDEVLLALLLGGPDAAEIAREVNLRFPKRARLRRASLEDLAAIPGLDPVRAATLQAAIELGRRITASPWPKGGRLRSSREVYRALAPSLRDLRREVFLVILLDGRNRKICEVPVSLGSLSASIVHPREVFLPAIKTSAAAILVAHNHPSGDPHPSPEDREVTWRLAKAGDLLGIRLLDHVIIGEPSYYSFADEGHLRQDEGGEGRRGASGYRSDRPNRCSGGKRENGLAGCPGEESWKRDE